MTGATGFVGRQVVLALAARGFEVIATARTLPVDAPDGVVFEQVDLLEPAYISRVLRAFEPEGLVHCAWDATPGKYWTSPENLRWVASTLGLAESFVCHGGRRAVFVGTSAEYSWNSSKTLREDSPLQPDSLYGVCKHRLHEIISAWSKQVGLSYAWARLFCPFGPGEKSVRLIPRTIARLNAGERIEFDSGMAVRDFLSVNEVGDAFAALFQSDVQGAVNIASGRDTTVRELLSCLAIYLQRENQLSFDQLPEPANQPPRIVANVERLSMQVGWRPRKSFEEQLAQTCEWHLHQLGTAAQHRVL